MRAHVRKLKFLLENYDIEWSKCEQMKVWMLVMAALETYADAEKAWLVHELAETLKCLDIYSFESFKSLLEDIYWCAEVHDSGLMKLWIDIARLVSPSKQ
jgi:hypothetical protein